MLFAINYSSLSWVFVKIYHLYVTNKMMVSWGVIKSKFLFFLYLFPIGNLLYIKKKIRKFFNIIKIFLELLAITKSSAITIRRSFFGCRIFRSWDIVVILHLSTNLANQSYVRATFVITRVKSRERKIKLPKKNYPPKKRRVKNSKYSFGNLNKWH